MKPYNPKIKRQALEMRNNDVSLPNIARSLSIPISTVARWTSSIKKICHPHYKTKEINHNYFSGKNLELFPERFVIVGFAAADGCIFAKGKGQKKLIFNISKKDKIALEIINNEICKGKRPLFHKKNNSVMMDIPSNAICCDLAKYNIVPRKTKCYNLPKLNLIQMSYFLRGYFYGDGCLYGKTPGTKGCYIVCTPMFAKSLQTFLLKNKINACKIYPIKNSTSVVQVHIKGRQGAKFSKFIFPDKKIMLIPRKHQLIEETISFSRWTAEEKTLLTQFELNEFCKLTGRSASSAKSAKYRFKYYLPSAGISSSSASIHSTPAGKPVLLPPISFTHKSVVGK